MPKWTENQWDAIEARRGTLLVSAAAGSGKTAVLVERLIKRITDTQNPTDAHRLLVVTYTNAAAAQMKDRTLKAVNELLKTDPENKHLKRQQMLIPSMNISTVHSFCSKLCREYFHVLGIAHDFKIVTDKQRDDLINGALTDALDKRFELGDYALADAFSTERIDTRLNETVIKLYEFTNSHLNPKKWLEEKLSMYTSSANIELTPWGKILCEYAKQAVSLCIKLSFDSLKMLEEDQVLREKYAPNFESDIDGLKTLLETIEVGAWDDIVEQIQNFNFTRLASVKGYKDDPLKIRVSGSRGTVKDEIDGLRKIFCYSSEQCKEDIENTAPLAKSLIELTLDFAERFSEQKSERKLVDYSDLEHMCIKLLLSEKDGITVPSEISLQVAEQFDEVMVDEYQDTNEVQDWIFTAVSKNGSNKFMVGDLKQCIYSFRQAMPDIFIGYKDSFLKYDRDKDKYPATVILDKNFRSRDTVINSINFVFDKLMSRDCGGVDYNKDEALSLGASYPESENCYTQIDFLDKPNTGASTTEHEASHIASIIHDIINSDFMVNEGESSRKPRYSDFCILLRSAKSKAGIYAKELEKKGISAWSQTTGGFFERKEIMQLMSFLQIIDNPNQDIPLLSVLTGPIYGYSFDDIAKLRVNNKQGSLYVCVLNDEKFSSFIEDMERYRLLAAHMATDVFIDTLYAQTSFENIVCAMENGEERLANIRKLRQYAGEFEANGYIGISGFVKFIDKMKKNNSDLEGATLVSEKADAVKIMSIHKSKGLEFPVCIVAGCGGRKRVEVDDVLLNSRLGIGMKLRDRETNVKFSNIIREAVLLENKMSEMSEELRVLYVAMTRAKEKLIMVSTLPSVEKALASVNALITSEHKIKPYVVKSMSITAQWLMLCALKHPNGKYLRDIVGAEDTIIARDNYTPWNIRVISENKVEEDVSKIEVIKEELIINSDIVAGIKDKINFEYKNAHLNEIPAKVSASMIAHKQNKQRQSLIRPSFLSYEGLTPTERGIALHSFIEFCDLENAYLNPKAELERLVAEGFITREQSKVINFDKVKAFLSSVLGEKIRNSTKTEREYRFTCLISAKLLDDSFDEDINVTLQGAVDCVFEWEDKLYVVDFKTDRKDDPQELADMYGIQLKLYANALEKVKGKKVAECYLYSFYLDKEIPLTTSEVAVN